MDIPMLVDEVRDQLANLDVSAHIEIRLAQPQNPRCGGKSGSVRPRPDPVAIVQDDILDITLSEVVVTSLPLMLPLAVPDAQVAGFRDRLGAALGQSLANQPLWLVRRTLVDVRIGRRLYKKELEVTCEYGVVGATVASCPRHGWEARAARFHAVVLPELDAEFQLVDVRPAI